ncbi:3-dehydroquinate synthase [Thermotomaculum hydrothermale]|uniref:3-dehydroquinate synthase n=1 Tax=Thermotomaculum hydrothermale TaxID=981385 RepID=A0A7R6PEQ2_9BACT|nr:3-dehydroquinate synthase [Thermotomaculum hydrothermale]BBB32313.1 3-dehydroquinate synthase [Thermotomaculum hydrothermale]
MRIKLKSHSESESLIFSLPFTEIKDYLYNLEINGKSVFFIVDKSLLAFKQYRKFLENKRFFLFNATEDNKSLESFFKIHNFLLQNKADRKSLVVGVGGGITLDITGFAATTFMRGVKFGFIPTTLLAMVDASIGGKNGVNFKGFKNYIGTFNHPSFVLISPEFLKTLPQKEFNVGLAEIIKYGAIYKPELLDFLVSNNEAIKSKTLDALSYLIDESVKSKVEIVEKDFKESGLRKILNFGHTLGHALERLKKVSHGEGVAAGMVFASYLSFKKGYLREKEFKRIVEIIKLYGLPDYIKDVNLKDILEGIAGDKKKDGEKIDFILLKGFGKPVIEAMDLLEIENGLQDLRKYYRI